MSNIINTHILLLEDEPHIALDVANILRDEGYQVTTTLTAKAALAAMEKKDNLPDIAILDIDLETCREVAGRPVDKHFAGIEVAKEITKIRSIPIVFLTAYADDPKIYEKAKAVCPVAFFDKGVTDITRDLPRAIDLAINNHISELTDELPSGLGAFLQGKICINAKVQIGSDDVFRKIILKKSDILYIKGMGQRLMIRTKSDNYDLGITFGRFKMQLEASFNDVEANTFMEVIKGGIVNLNNVVAFNDGQVYFDIHAKHGFVIRKSAYLQLLKWFPPMKTKP